MKSKVTRWYRRHNTTVDVIIDIICDILPGAAAIKGILKVGKATIDDKGEDFNDQRIQDLEDIVAEIKPSLMDLVEEIEELKDFQNAITKKQAKQVIKDSHLAEELNMLMPKLNESISRSMRLISYRSSQSIIRACPYSKIFELCGWDKFAFLGNFVA